MSSFTNEKSTSSRKFSLSMTGGTVESHEIVMKATVTCWINYTKEGLLIFRYRDSRLLLS